MSTGEGIFYGLVFIGLVLLYVATRDRWNWGKIAKFSAGTLLLPIVAAGTWAAYSSYMESRPKFQSEFWGISPGVPKGELIFQKGQPTQDEGEVLTYRVEGSSVVYLIRMTSMGNVRSVLAVVELDKGISLPNIQGISSYSTLADIESKFGKADVVSSNKEGTRRLFSYLKFGIVVGMEKGTVTAVGVLDPTEGPLRFKDS
jgi:hypothetical protein